jgi:hypothetical protein
MDSSILVSRRELLLRNQNADGGWGYFAGKQSWLEPTVYAMLALQGEPAAKNGLDRSWNLIRSMQMRDGGFKPCRSFNKSTWVTALAVTACSVRGEFGPPFQSGVKWLVGTTGFESSTWIKVRKAVGLAGFERETKWRGWPWMQDTAAWVEPTAQSILALKKAAQHFPQTDVTDRVADGEKLLLAVRTRDGGWNAGNPVAARVDQVSYPETTALALLGLQSAAPQDAVRLARDSYGKTKMRLADAWTSVALQTLGAPTPAPPVSEAPADLMIAAIECLGAPGGNAILLREKEIR